MIKDRSRPEGLGAIVYHGMLHGLAVILAAVELPPCHGSDRYEPINRALPRDREFVRVLANMLLRSQSEVMHVY